LYILTHGISGEKYNIPGSAEVSNLDLAQRIAAILGKELLVNLVAVHDARPGHDTRYSLDGTKLAELGWTPPPDFDESLRSTVEWTLQHPEWLQP
jgi:dTDP-glucose 4,6-dehydratase